MSEIRAWLPVLAVAAVAALAMVGCGDDDDEETTPPTGRPDQTLKVSETEFQLDPANPTVKPGTVAFKVTNDGEVDHNLEVEGPAGEAEFDQDLAPGESGKLEVDLSEPGTYTWYCPVGDHEERGMGGEITVAGGGSARDGEESGQGGGSEAPTGGAAYDS